MFELRSACTLVLFAGAVAMLPPTADAVREFGSWCLRPARLPFAWQAMISAREDGDAREVFARGQQILQLVPSWTDGHAAFVYNYVATQDYSLEPDAVTAAVEERLHAGLAMLEDARRFAGRREASLLHFAAYMPDMLCNRFPDLREHMRRGDRGSASVIANRYFAEIERLFPTAATREQLLWHVPAFAASQLATGNLPMALDAIDTAITKAPEIRNQELATEWRERLVEVARYLRGATTVDLSQVFEDQRFDALWPYLR